MNEEGNDNTRSPDKRNSNIIYSLKYKVLKCDFCSDAINFSEQFLRTSYFNNIKKLFEYTIPNYLFIYLFVGLLKT